MNVSQVKSERKWSQVGTAVFKLAVFQMRVPLFLSGKPIDIVERLGEIREGNDGRWKWFRIPSKYISQFWIVPAHEQGVAETKELAIAEVEKAFAVEPADHSLDCLIYDGCGRPSAVDKKLKGSVRP